MKQKLSSRKLWAMIAGVVIGASTIFGLDMDTVDTISGAVVALGSVIAYIVAEGKIDAAGVAGAAEKVQDAVDAVREDAQ